MVPGSNVMVTPATRPAIQAAEDDLSAPSRDVHPSVRLGPGGSTCGCNDQWVHSSPALPALPAASRAGRRGSDFAELRRRVQQEGLLDRRPRYYLAKIVILAAMLAAGCAAFVLLGDSWYQIGVAVYLAAVFGQIGFLGWLRADVVLARPSAFDITIGIL